MTSTEPEVKRKEKVEEILKQLNLDSCANIDLGMQNNVHIVRGEDSNLTRDGELV